MYDRFGSPGFLAGYNAGPDRVDAYLAGQNRLPNETVNYLAAIAPNLGDAVPPSGPLARYAATRPTGFSRHATIASLAAGCDLNAAYDPNHPCTSLEQAAVAPALPPLRQMVASGCDTDAAFDPNHPCSAPPQAAVALAVPQSPHLRRLAANDCSDYPCRFAQKPAPHIQLAFNTDCGAYAALAKPCSETAKSAAPRAISAELPAAEVAGYRASPRHTPSLPAHDWAIQVGAFANPALARAVAEGARRQAPSQLRYASLTLPATPFRRSVLYRARLAHLSQKEAAEACTHLNRRQLPCVVVRPSRS
jgi:hypothetical protein